MKAGERTPLVRVALGLVSLALVLWLFTLQVDKASPGPLANAHAQDPELLRRGACARCHGEGEVAMAEACGRCHAEIETEIHTASGFHGALTGLDARACANCHGEHAGGDFQLVSQRSFALAGFATRAAYDHAQLDFRLQGRHAELACKDCHANADKLLLPRGETRFLGLAQGCQNCHEDAHQGRIVRACAECHGQEHPFALVASFEHDRFASACAHAAVSCEQCHPKGGPNDVELLASAAAPRCARSCETCHTSPHGAAFTAAADVLADAPRGEGCAACHSEGFGGFRGHLEAMPPAMHAATGFALDKPHNALACEACHLEVAGDEAAFGVHVPARTQDDCASCHGDPHGGQFDGTQFGAEGCLACHAREVFEPSTFGPEEHARSDFPLVASHQAVACVRCHEQAHSDEPRRFEGTDASCSACHADAHRGAFDEFENPEGCAHCHEPTLFAEYKHDGFEHADWTGFALEGAHARAECEACHAKSPRPDESGRTFGFVSAVFGEPVERCSTCHQDPHDGRFDRPGLAATLGGRTDCARCHSSESFTTPLDGTFEHERWTGYPLAAFHADVECNQCHVPAAAPDAVGRTFGRAPTRCADCHADPHVGQFVVDGTTDCARCHQDAGGLAFDHQRDSRFALDAVHAKVACAACHVPWPLPDGGTAVRYKPLGVECADCHDPDFVRRAQRGERPKSSRGGFSLKGSG